MKRIIIAVAISLCNLLIASEATSAVPEENLRIARFEVRHHPWGYLDSKNNV
ncbi:MAG: hypothetical protein NT128_08170 [Proteobacteria bacterium]|nr:hypothetical protein [Pseudomonadota bacterium]